MPEERPKLPDIGRLAAQAVGFMTTEIWRIRTRDLPRARSFFIRLIRIIILTFRGLAEDRCQLRASALTFYSLLSVVPVLAMIFGIAKGFGFEKNLQDILLERLTGQEEVAARIIDFSHALLENVKGGLVAGIGIAILFYTIIKILSHIENAFNDVWGIKQPRSLGRKITDYLSMILICPVLFLMSSGATIVIASGVQLVTEKVSLLGALSPLISFLLSFLPYCVMWILFTFIYMFMPNGRVQISSALLAAVIAGTAYHLFQWIYIFFQVNVTKYNAVYGSFAALPLFFIWLQISWLIVLFGAEISFAHQNVDSYEFEKDCHNASQSFKRLLSLRIVQLIVQNFSEGPPLWTALAISHHLEIPIRLVNQLLFELVDAGILSEVYSKGDSDKGYHPAQDPDNLTIKTVLDALDFRGNDKIPVAPSREMERLSQSLQDFGRIIEASPSNLRLKSL